MNTTAWTVRLITLAVALTWLGTALAEVPPPTDDQVLIVVKEQLSDWKVCGKVFPAPVVAASPSDPSNDILLTRGSDFSDHPDVAKQINALIAVGLLTREKGPDANEGKPTSILKLTATGKQVKTGCYTVRKVSEILAYTPPVLSGDYWVVHVSYY